MASLTMKPIRLRTPFLSSTPLRTQTGRAQPPAIPRSTQHRKPYSTRSDSLPKIVRPSFWASMIPKPLRSRFSSPSSRQSTSSAPKSQEWNPASFYIIIFILIGSQAIRMVALKNEYRGYVRSAEAKIRLLNELIGKVKRGEEVDVERMLGTGDQRVEREWEDVLREIEQEDSLWHQKQKKADQEAEADSPVQAEKQEEKELKKDPAVPAVDKADQSTAKDNQTKRKVSFF
ncbi:hypothetical protein BDW62DRAFT_74443 [Aspergillus aurantiobrunneus]